jgi:hypothetical protein
MLFSKNQRIGGSDVDTTTILRGGKTKTKKKKTGSDDGCLIFKIQKLGPEEDTWTYMPHNE